MRVYRDELCFFGASQVAMRGSLLPGYFQSAILPDLYQPVVM